MTKFQIKKFRIKLITEKFQTKFQTWYVTSWPLLSKVMAISKYSLRSLKFVKIFVFEKAPPPPPKGGGFKKSRPPDSRWFLTEIRNRHNFWCMCPSLMIFVPIESWDSGLAIGTKITQIRYMYPKLWRFWISIKKSHRIRGAFFLKKPPPSEGGAFFKKTIFHNFP